MIHNILKFSQNISIQAKVMMGVILFTVLIGAIERYQISQNIINQFFEAKKSKNLLLINTISPIIGLNISLGLYDANTEYLNYIVQQNPDIIFVELKDSDNQVVYNISHDAEMKYKYKNKGQEYIDFCNKQIVDNVSENVIGNIHIYFSQQDFYKLQSANRLLTFKLVFIIFILLSIFVYLIRRELRPLKKLTETVLAYDPKLNNFPLPISSKKDEVGVIQNAILLMVDKIGSHTQMLDQINLSLEEKVKERTKELYEANQQLKALSVTDDLTKLSNRRYFEEYFQKSWELAKRKNVNLSLVMCDIDHFKKVNDIYGHQIGDEVLKAVAIALKEALKRGTDFVARYGGEEFIMVLYETNLQEAQSLCQRVQENLKILKNEKLEGVKISSITMSFGIACTIPKKDDNSDSLIKYADDALYNAKETGRNKIITSEF